MNFPLEFNINIYKFENNFLKMNKNELINHYNTYGCNEGLISCEIKNRECFINLIPKNVMILEIGPLCNPVNDVNSPNVHTLDYFTREELIENYKNDPNVNIENISNITYVIKNEKYKDKITCKYDICFSSHNIEHTPCLINFLNNVSDILKDNSYFFLCIPDYRYCFDHFRNPTNIFHILNSYYNNENKPSKISILENKYMTSHNYSYEYWNSFESYKRNIFNDINDKNIFFNDRKTIIINEIENIKKIFEMSNDYIDSHCWTFTPASFRNIIDILYTTNYINLKIERVYKTLKNSNEFYVILKKE